MTLKSMARNAPDPFTAAPIAHGIFKEKRKRIVYLAIDRTRRMALNANGIAYGCEMFFNHLRGQQFSPQLMVEGYSTDLDRYSLFTRQQPFKLDAKTGRQSLSLSAYGVENSRVDSFEHPPEAEILDSLPDQVSMVDSLMRTLKAARNSYPWGVTVVIDCGNCSANGRNHVGALENILQDYRKANIQIAVAGLVQSGYEEQAENAQIRYGLYPNEFHLIAKPHADDADVYGALAWLGATAARRWPRELEIY